MSYKTSAFCLLTLLLGAIAPAPAYADLDINPVPFNAEKFTEKATAQSFKEPEINIKTLLALEPASGGVTKSPEPQYMVSINTPAPHTREASQATQNVIQTTLETLQNGQKVRITVEKEPDLSSIYTINANGQIEFPLIGKVQASQSTPSTLKETLTSKLKDGYLINPSIKVEKISSDPIFVLGDVITPGKPIYVENISIASAILRAGGYEKSAKPNQFEILRTKTNDPGLITVTQDEEKLISGDVLIVKGY